MTIAEDFHRLDTDRNVALNRKREHAALTIPSLLPREGHTLHTQLEVPYSTVPAEGINGLAARTTSVVFPLNGQSIFEIVLRSQFAPEGSDDSEMTQSFRRLEKLVMDVLAPTNLRATAHLGYKQLIALGDALLHMDDDFNFRAFRPDQFVLRRKHEGDWREIIIVEAVLPEWEPDLPSAPNAPVAPLATTVIPVSPQGEKWDALYTRVVKNDDGSVEVTQEFHDKEVGRKTHKVSPFFPARWTPVSGEPYGTSLVEDMFGEIRCLDALSKSLLDLALLASEHRWGVNPAGLTELQDVLNSVNGSAIAASQGDVFPLQFTSGQAMQALFAAVQHREAVVGRRFLMNSAVQPQGERVTARQVSILAQELESMLGGVLSSAARDFQEPVIKRVLSVMADKKMLPANVVEEINKEGGFISLRIRAGLEILNREAERAKLDEAIERMRNLPPQAMEAFVWPEIARDWWQSMGLEDKGRIRTPEEMAQIQQAQQQAAMQAQAAQAGIQAGVDRAAAGEQPQ